MSTPEPRIIPNSTDNRNPIYTQVVEAQRFPPVEGFGAVADQTPQKVAYVNSDSVDDDGNIVETTQEIMLVPHNMRCEPPKGFNR